MNNTIKISVIVPCYNQGIYLPAALDSVLNQTYDKWECIVINDGSTDSTEEIAKSYCKKDDRFKYFYKINGGLSSARNLGLKNATGDFIQFLDSDDIIVLNKFEIQLNSLAETDTDVLVSDYSLFKGKSSEQFDNYLSLQPFNLTLEGFLYKWVALEFVFAIHCALVRRNFLIKNYIDFNESARALEDWIFWCTLAIKKARFSHQPFKLAYYRVHKNSMTTNQKQILLSTFQAVFIVEKILPESHIQEYRERISEILIERISRLLRGDEYLRKEDSVEYKIGYFILVPKNKISFVFNKANRKLKSTFRKIFK